MAKKAKKVRNIEITESFDNSVKVNILHSPKMSEAVDALVELEERSFRRVVRVAKSYRRANGLANRLFDSRKVDLTVIGTDSSFEIINTLISFEKAEFKKILSCAKKYRRANKMLVLAITNYKELKDEDVEALSQRMGKVYV